MAFSARLTYTKMKEFLAMKEGAISISEGTTERLNQAAEEIYEWRHDLYESVLSKLLDASDLADEVDEYTEKVIIPDGATVPHRRLRGIATTNRVSTSPFTSRGS